MTSHRELLARARNALRRMNWDHLFPLIAEIDAALAEPDDGWMPIPDVVDTTVAPFDGSEILLYAAENPAFPGSGIRVTSGSYFIPSLEPYDDEEPPQDFPHWMSWDGGFLVDWPPTKWRPLPKPPVQS